MGLLVCTVLAGAVWSAVLLVLRASMYFRLKIRGKDYRNWPFASRARPRGGDTEDADIDPPMWLAVLDHMAGMLCSCSWLLRWSSITELRMTMTLIPLLCVPFPTLLNNLLEGLMAVVFGDARGRRSLAGRADEWRRALTAWLGMLHGRGAPPEGLVNFNHALLCYALNEGAERMHDLGHCNPACDIGRSALQAFPGPQPGHANAVVMAKAATMSYDRWHNVDRACNQTWEPAEGGGSTALACAWSFDRVPAVSEIQDGESDGDPQLPPVSARLWAAVSAGLSVLRDGGNGEGQHCPPSGAGIVARGKGACIAARKAWIDTEKKYNTSVNTDVCLLRIQRPLTPEEGKGDVVAYVLAFRGTEALQTIDWVSDLSDAQPPVNASDLNIYPNGFTHKGFRDALGLTRKLLPADEDDSVEGRFKKCSYLYYEPNPNNVPNETSPTPGQAPDKPSPDDWSPGSLTRVCGPKSPFTVITAKIAKQVDEDKAKGLKVKVFVTGHSLGGALTHLYGGALLLRAPWGGQADSALKGPSRAEEIAARAIKGLWTFGQPRVGGVVFVNGVEDELRKRFGRANGRYVRVVNTLDVVPRIPPPIGELYQHAGHLTFIKPKVAICQRETPRDDNDERGRRLAPMRSPIMQLAEMPEIYLGPTVTTALLKLALSAVLLAAAMVKGAHGRWPRPTEAALVALCALAAPLLAAPLLAAAAVAAAALVGAALVRVLSPHVYIHGLQPSIGQVLTAAHQLLRAVKRPLDRSPLLVANPAYALCRVVGVLGPAPLVAALDLLLLPWFVATGMLPFTLVPELLLLAALMIMMPPFIMSGLVDHSMVEYHLAAWLSADADWAPRGCACPSARPATPDLGGGEAEPLDSPLPPPPHPPAPAPPRMARATAREGSQTTSPQGT